MLSATITTSANHSAGTSSFAEKSAIESQLRPEFRPNYPRIFANAGSVRGVPIASPRGKRRGRQREAHPHSQRAAPIRARSANLSPRPGAGSDIAVRYRSELARHLRIGDRYTNRDSSSDRGGDSCGRWSDQLGLGHRLRRWNRRDLRFASDRCLDPRHVRCLEQIT